MEAIGRRGTGLPARDESGEGKRTTIDVFGSLVCRPNGLFHERSIPPLHGLVSPCHGSLRYTPAMAELKPDECRVLGVLIEKAQTVPGQYPITLNALTTGCNQKNNRSPVVEWDEDRVLDALDGLRAKRL